MTDETWPELSDAARVRMREKALARLPLETYGHMSDEWVANRAFMATSNDLELPAVTVAARDRIMRLSRWVNQLQSGMTINCVYCGHCYGPADTTPVTRAEILTAHLEVCLQHPMNALKRENEQLRAKVKKLESHRCAGFNDD